MSTSIPPYLRYVTHLERVKIIGARMTQLQKGDPVHKKLVLTNRTMTIQAVAELEYSMGLIDMSVHRMIDGAWTPVHLSKLLV
jgi:hypothetical protein